jgi:two-component system, NarL family, nitrate/nitrite response regulator NarL
MKRSSYRRARRKPERLSLTRREQEVCVLVADGLGNKAIARKLGLALGTVKIHLHRAFNKTRFSNRTELAVWMVRQ